MRTLVSLSLAMCGCHLLPHVEVSCDESDRCGPLVIQSPFVLGQPDAQTNWLLRGQGSPQGVAIVGNRLLVADSEHHRVLVWSSFPTQSNQPPDLVLGQDSLSTQAATASLPYAARLASDGTRLAVGCDGLQTNRLVLWTQFPGASSVRSDFSIDPGAAPTAAGARVFSGAGPLFASGRLYLADRGFSRILLWNTAPASAADASLAIGQSSLTMGTANAGGAIGVGTLSGPDGSPATDGTRLFVADTRNHRVLVWNTLPTANVGADLVLGQAGFTTGAANRGSLPGLDTLNSPSAVSASGARLAVADSGNNRVLLWSQLPTANAQAASLVLGHASGSLNQANPGGVSASTLSGPRGVATDGTRVVVADTSNNRVLLWSSWPGGNGAPADLVLGQAAMSSGAFEGRFASEKRFLSPVTVARAGKQLLLVDRDAHRVLIWPRLPTSASEVPSVVLGQPDMAGTAVNGGAAVSARGLDTPRSVASDGTLLAVADSGNNRVLIWKSIPRQSHQPADLVLGQASLTGSSANSNGASRGLATPCGVYVEGGRIYVADTVNDRLLIWKTVPQQNQQPPDIVLGQADFSGTASNRGGAPAANTLAGPSRVFAGAARIYVSDATNNRVLIWNTLNPSNGQAADVVLGQSGFTSGVRAPVVSAATLLAPLGLFSDGKRLYVADSDSHRVLFWNGIPAQSGMPADGVIGQLDLSGAAPNPGGLASDRVQSPYGILATEAGLYIADTDNGRVLALPPLP